MKAKLQVLDQRIGTTTKDPRKHLAFKFASRISVEFKLCLIKAFQRLKEQGFQQLRWDIWRNLARLLAIRQKRVLAEQGLSRLPAGEAE